MVSVPNHSQEGRETIPSSACPNSVHSRGVLTLTEKQRWFHPGKEGRGDFKGEILKGAAQAGTENVSTNTGCSSSSAEAALTTSALTTRVRVQPCTWVTSALKGVVKGVYGAGSCQSSSPADIECRSAPLDAVCSSTDREAKQAACRSLCR